MNNEMIDEVIKWIDKALEDDACYDVEEVHLPDVEYIEEYIERHQEITNPLQMTIMMLSSEIDWWIKDAIYNPINENEESALSACVVADNALVLAILLMRQAQEWGGSEWGSSETEKGGLTK